MTVEDVFTILVQQDMITVDTAFPNSARPSPGQSIKFPRGRRNGIARRHLQRPNQQKQTEGGGNKSNTPFAAPAHYEISWDEDKVERWLESWEKKGYLRLKPEKLKWTPFVLSRTKAGVELLQAEAGLVFGAVAHTSTPRSPMDGGTPILDIGDRAKSLGSGQSSSNEQNEQAVVVRDVAEVTAAHLFDELFPEKMVTPKKQLRKKRRDGSPDSIAKSTRSPSAQAVLDGDSGPNGENSDASLVGTSNDVQRIEDVTPTLPIKRRRGRPPRIRLPDKAPDVPQSFSTETGLTSPQKPTSPWKRRKLDSPTPEDLHASMDLAYTEGHDGPDDQPVVHHPLVVNGEGHATNGVHRGSPRRSPDTSLPIGTTEGVNESEQRGDIAQQECTDVKSEDLGTPLTGLTSRHSVPSDDTVFVAEGVNGSVVRSKISGEGEGISQDRGATEDAVALRVVVEEDSDLDAEGEPDDEI
jgi:hypothetical protein